MNTMIDFLEADLQSGYAGPNWIEISLKGTLGQIDHITAFREAPGNVHSIAEIVCHLIAWRKALIEALESKQDWKVDQEASFDTVPYGEMDINGWTNIKTILEDTQKQLSRLIKSMDPSLLAMKVPQRKYDFRYFIIGTIQHDAYHLGQIVMLSKQQMPGN